MWHDFFSALSGTLVAISIIPYLRNVYKGDNNPQLLSWVLWTLIGFVLLLTYISAATDGSAVPVAFGFINPLCVVMLMLWKLSRSKDQKDENPLKSLILEQVKEFSWFEWGCALFGLLALVLWTFVQSDPRNAQLALYTAILADVCAAVPTLLFVIKNGDKERPFAWLMYSAGYAIAIPLIHEQVWVNYALPVYMSVGTLCIAVPTVMYRLRKGVPLRHWL